MDSVNVNIPPLPSAHQQIRLGDIQASEQKWVEAIKHYQRAIKIFEDLQSSLKDTNLILIIQIQIEQCNKTINLCRLKQSAEKAKLLLHEKKSAQELHRAYSTANLETATKTNVKMLKHRTVDMENTDYTNYDGNYDSLAALVFKRSAGTNDNQKSKPIVAKKNKKNDKHILEELQTKNEALKNHLQDTLDENERLRNENKLLRMKQNPQFVQEESVTSSNEDLSESELVSTI